MRPRRWRVPEKKGRKKAVTGENCERYAAVETERAAGALAVRAAALSVRSAAAPLSPAAPGEIVRLFSRGLR
jgi:hypothetical protein